MKLKIDRGSDRLMAWTDKRNGYLLLSTAVADGPDSGYWRGNARLLSDFFVPMSGDEADLYRTNAVATEVRPDGFTSEFADEGVSLSVSLLLGEGAFFLSCAGASSAGILFPPDLPIGGVGSWTRSDSPGVTSWACDAHGSHGSRESHSHGYAVAVASSDPFDLETVSGGRVCLHARVTWPVWYLAFAATRERARETACRLVESRAVEAHREKVASFLDACSIESGDERFDDAVRWARFSAWMLSMNEGSENGMAGMWGGLPWFREYWSRDEFASMCGSLLVSGRFAEARAILVAAARTQNRDRASSDFGRLPNRLRSETDRIYNTADGTLWFIRAAWEYVQYSGDASILREVGDAIDVALEADRTRRCDERGFLVHADAETWMDARAPGGAPYAPRGDRACEIQALWYSALLAGASFARMAGDDALAQEREGLALRVRIAFHRSFWSDSRNALADCLSRDGRGGDMPDYRVRPNQLLAVSVPAALGDGSSDFLEPSRQRAVVENATRELVSPVGLFSLCPDDPLFHPTHADCEFHRKDAAYHNGTVWLWTTGAYVSSCARTAPKATLPHAAAALLMNEAAMLLDARCAGALDGIAQAECGADGKPVFTGVWSQARAEAEFSRNAFQDVTGFTPRLAEGRIELRPRLPAGVSRWRAKCPFGPGWTLSVELTRNREERKVLCSLVWDAPSGSTPSGATALSANGTPITPSVPLALSFDDETAPDAANHAFTVAYRANSFEERNLRPDWCAAIHEKDALERLVSRARDDARSRAAAHGGATDGAHGSAHGGDHGAGAHGGHAVASAPPGAERSLERYFDSDRFKRKYLTTRALGATYGSDRTTFRLWAPTARSVSLVLYPDGDTSPPSVVLPMEGGPDVPGAEGTWELAMSGDLHGAYYRFRVRAHGIVRDTADPYARACGVNGGRSMVVDFARTNPAGWKTAEPPKLRSPNDAVVYEAHVADISSSPSWNGDPRARRKYQGASARGTSVSGVPSGFDHIRSLGVTHVQLLPIFDFSSVDESRPRETRPERASPDNPYNWGYDPYLWSAPEGSYSTDAHNGAARVIELKSMLRDYLSCGIGVVMDVVYNHVPSAADHPFGVCVPGYYFRAESQSGAGDDTASERAMFSRFMVDSLCWWMSEYKLSGFRFDLMGLHDVETMNAVSSALRKIRGDALLYGEGWDMYRGGKMVAASMLEARKLADYGFFNDAFRCGVKGPVFSADSTGFIHDGSHREALKFGLVGAVFHPQVHNRQVDGTANRNPWSDRTAASVNFVEIHDNLTLNDKLALAEPDRDDEWYGRLQRMAIALVLLAQGMPVLHAGMEFMRTKELPADMLKKDPPPRDVSRTRDGTRAFSHNSYNLSDRVNALDWRRCADKRDLVDYVRALVRIRREHPAFRLRTEREVGESLSFVDVPSPLLAWTIDGEPSGDPWKAVCVVVNPSAESVSVRLPPCPHGLEWRLVSDGSSFDCAFSADIAPKALYLYAEF